MPRKPKEDKPAEPKKRGRKPREEKVVTEIVETPEEVVTQVEEVTSEKSSEEPVQNEAIITYNHLRYQRCSQHLNTRSHPAFLHKNMVCNTIMQSYKTTDNGKMKHYKCPRCGNIKVVEGEIV